MSRVLTTCLSSSTDLTDGGLAPPNWLKSNRLDDGWAGGGDSFIVSFGDARSDVLQVEGAAKVVVVSVPPTARGAAWRWTAAVGRRLSDNPSRCELTHCASPWLAPQRPSRAPKLRLVRQSAPSQRIALRLADAHWCGRGRPHSQGLAPLPWRLKARWPNARIPS